MLWDYQGSCQDLFNSIDYSDHLLSGAFLLMLNVDLCKPPDPASHTKSFDAHIMDLHQIDESIRTNYCSQYKRQRTLGPKDTKNNIF